MDAIDKCKSFGVGANRVSLWSLAHPGERGANTPLLEFRQGCNGNPRSLPLNETANPDEAQNRWIPRGFDNRLGWFDDAGDHGDTAAAA